MRRKPSLLLPKTTPLYTLNPSFTLAKPVINFSFLISENSCSYEKATKCIKTIFFFFFLILSKG